VTPSKTVLPRNSPQIRRGIAVGYTLNVAPRARRGAIDSREMRAAESLGRHSHASSMSAAGGEGFAGRGRHLWTSRVSVGAANSARMLRPPTRTDPSSSTSIRTCSAARSIRARSRGSWRRSARVLRERAPCKGWSATTSNGPCKLHAEWERCRSLAHPNGRRVDSSLGRKRTSAEVCVVSMHRHLERLDRLGVAHPSRPRRRSLEVVLSVLELSTARHLIPEVALCSFTVATSACKPAWNVSPSKTMV
jgi:hypothetical protein